MLQNITERNKPKIKQVKSDNMTEEKKVYILLPARKSCRSNLKYFI